MPQPSAVTSLIDEGLAAQQTGDISAARKQYEAALKLSPNDPEALHLLGLVHEQEKDRAGAIALIERAVAIDPEEPIFRLNLAAILEKNRLFDLAAEHIRAAVSARPHIGELSASLGAIELLRDNAEDAATAFQRAYELDPKNIAALAGYGRAMLLMNNFADAQRAAQAAFRAAPSDIATLELALRIACRERDGRAIGQFTTIWKSIKSDDKSSLTDLANLLFELGYNNEACNTYEAVVALDPHSAETLIAYGRHCTASQKLDLADEALTKARAIDPKSLTGLYAMSRLEYFRGDFQSAEELCTRVATENPFFPPALTQLCALRRGNMSDENVEAMKALTENIGTEPSQAYELLLALGRVYDRRGSIDAAFATIERGNKIGKQISRQASQEFDRNECTAETDKITSFFRQSSPEHIFEPAPYVPIFVLGMPRSGTTLAESILAAHPEVFSIGEMSSLPAVAKDVMAWIDQTKAESIADATKEQLQSWRDLYFSYFPTDNPKSFMVDKQPINFRYAGIIRALFPEGKIVHIRRNPVETSFSIYRHPFNKGWPFSYQFDEIAHFYGDYARLVAHWEKTLGPDFPLFQYETLIADFEKEVRRMLAHCGLDWHEGCLEFHRTKRTIATFSSVQARQPVRKTPERAALRYHEFLEPLLAGLAAANIDLETGALNRTPAA